MTFRSKFGTPAALALALFAGASASAAPLSSVALAGTTQGYCASGTVVSACLATPALVTDNSPLGNIELGSLGGAIGTISGTAGLNSVTLSSLVLSDWTNALATDYITAAANSIGLGALLAGPGLGVALNTFFTNEAWKRLGDPNVAYVEHTDSLLTIGLAGVLDARLLLTSLFGSAVDFIPPQASVQASEVVKVTIAGNTSYLYSFVGEPTGLGTSTQGYSANYVVTADLPASEVPEPTSLALLGLGLAGLAAAKRRKAKQA